MRPSRIILVSVAFVALLAAFLMTRQRTSPAPSRATTGELIRCEVPTRTLTLRTEQGEGHFLVEEDAVFHEGSRTVELNDVCASLGHRIKILYRDSGNTPTIYDIRISLRAIARRPIVTGAPFA